MLVLIACIEALAVFLHAQSLFIILTKKLQSIISKKKKASGGNTTIPSYGVTVDSADNAMLVYPAWKSLHGVTPIKAAGHGGYRNTLVFYSLGSLRGKR